MIHLEKGTMSCKNPKCGSREINVTLAHEKRLAHLICPKCRTAWTMSMIAFENEAHGFNYGASR